VIQVMINFCRISNENFLETPNQFKITTMTNMCKQDPKEIATNKKIALKKFLITNKKNSGLMGTVKLKKVIHLDIR